MNWAWNDTLRLFAAGAILCNVTALLLVGHRLWARIRGRYVRDGFIVRNAAKVAAVLATAAMLGSLALSEIGPYEPCRWCWYQRVAMYPLALVLVVAWMFGDRKAHRYGIPLAAAGLAMSTWHYLIQRFPDLESAGACDVANPCTLTLTWQFRFVSIPYMAGSVFLAVLVLLVLSARRSGAR